MHTLRTERASSAAEHSMANSSGMRGTRELAVLFASLWACATLFHLGSFGKLTAFNHFLLAAAALAVIARPASVAALSMLAGLQLYDVALDLPTASNHWLFTGFVNLTLLYCVARTVWARDRHNGETSPPGPDNWMPWFASLARLELLILYGFAVLHKLNVDYLARESSCGVAFYHAMLERFTFLPNTPALEVASVYSPLIAEALIPILLVARRTRIAGILVGALLHVGFALDPIGPFYNFSSMLLAMFVLFAPPAVLPATRSWLESVANGQQARAARRALARPGPFACAIAVGVAAVDLLRRFLAGRDIFLFLFLIYGATLVGLLLRYVWSRTRARAWASGATADDYGDVNMFRLGRNAGLVFPILVLLNGASPYLGLKTETSFAMFSNLATEGGRSNHLFLRASLQPFPFQRDLVRIVASPDKQLAAVARQELRMPFLQLRILADRRPDTSLVYEREGRTYHIASTKRDPALGKPTPLIVRKLFAFRPIRDTPRQQCGH
jgi:hypothetical protein